MKKIKILLSCHFILKEDLQSFRVKKQTNKQTNKKNMVWCTEFLPLMHWDL